MAQAALDAKLVDEVYFSPCAGHAWNKSLVSADHRLAMCGIATSGTTKMRPFDYEINKIVNISGHTFDFITSLLAHRFYAGISWSYIIGQDNAEAITAWYDYKSLLKLIPFIVIGRAGATNTQFAWYKQAPHRFIKNTKVMTVSSTEVRQVLAKYGKGWARRKLRDKVDSLVLDYIFRHQLYGSES
jgi:nicotinic acid mononucleotide adenylyltransferase